MSLCKFTLGVAAGIAGALLYDAYKKGKISCCISSCCGEEACCSDKADKADKQQHKSAGASEGALHEAEPVGGR